MNIQFLKPKKYKISAILYKKLSLIDSGLFSKIEWNAKYAFCSLAAKDALAAISEDSESMG